MRNHLGFFLKNEIGCGASTVLLLAELSIKRGGALPNRPTVPPKPPIKHGREEMDKEI